MNTVVVRGNGKLYGYNTDYVGVLRTLQTRIPLQNSRVLIVGAGGARAPWLLRWREAGASVCVCARRIERPNRWRGRWAAKRSRGSNCAASFSTPS